MTFETRPCCCRGVNDECVRKAKGARSGASGGVPGGLRMGFTHRAQLGQNGFCGIRPDTLAFTKPLVKLAALSGAFTYRRGCNTKLGRSGLDLGYEGLRIHPDPIVE